MGAQKHANRIIDLIDCSIEHTKFHASYFIWKYFSLVYVNLGVVY